MSVTLTEYRWPACLTLSKAGFIERSTQARVPGNIQVSLIPSTLDLGALEQFSPRITGLRRWTSNPRVLFLKSVVDYVPGTEFNVTDRELSDSVVECTTRHVGEDVEALTGGILTVADVQVVSAAPKSRFALGTVPEGTIVIMAARSLGSNGRGAGYLGSQP